MIGYTSLAVGSSLTTLPLSIACFAALSAISFPATLQCDGHQSMFKVTFLSKIKLISLSIGLVCLVWSCFFLSLDFELSSGSLLG